MSSKENAAINQLFEKPECRCAARAVGSAGWTSPDLPSAARQRWRHHPEHPEHPLYQGVTRVRPAGDGSDGYTVTLTGQDPSAPI